MQYVALIYYPESEHEGLQEQIWEEYNAFLDDERTRKVFRGGDALGSSALATRLRMRDGRKSILDGPFAETKEQLGGFMILDCDDLDEALEVASRIPDAARGTVEVRPLAQHPACHNVEAEWRQ